MGIQQSHGNSVDSWSILVSLYCKRRRGEIFWPHILTACSEILYSLPFRNLLYTVPDRQVLSCSEMRAGAASRSCTALIDKPWSGNFSVDIAKQRQFLNAANDRFTRTGSDGEMPQTLDINFALVERLLAAAEAAEPQMTAFIVSIVEQLGGRLDGLDYKLKTRVSLTRKIRTFVQNVQRDAAAKGETMSQCMAEETILLLHTCEPGKAGLPIVVDTLRYTVVFPADKYTAGVSAIREQLTESQYTTFDQKNFWIGTQVFRGINDCYKVPTQDDLHFIFELQFHTDESLEAKTEGHKIYRVFRETKDEDTKLQLHKQMCELVQALHLPVGVLELPQEVKRPPPSKT